MNIKRKYGVLADDDIVDRCCAFARQIFFLVITVRCSGGPHSVGMQTGFIVPIVLWKMQRPHRLVLCIRKYQVVEVIQLIKHDNEK